MTALALCVFLAGAPPVDAKHPTPPVFSSGLEMVNLTVSVVDGQGHLISDLEPSDLVVLEDGRPQAVTLFSRAVESGHKDELVLNLGLLMDTSESMLDELKLSQEAATRFLEAIPRAGELLTIFFDHDIQVSHYDSESQQGLFGRIADLKGGGNTALYDAIAVYLSRVQETNGRKVVVLFTDGEDTSSTLSLGELYKLINSSTATIYPVGMMQGFSPNSSRAMSSRSFLLQIAELSGGHMFSPSSSRDLPEIYRKILDELAAQYVVGFVSDSPRHDGKFRKIEVQVKRKGLKARTRTGYLPPREGPESVRH